MILSKTARLLMCDGKYKNVESVRKGNAFLDHNGQLNQIMNIKPVLLNASISIRNRNWYLPTKLPLETMVFTKQNTWEHVYNLEVDTKLKNLNIIRLLESNYGGLYADVSRTTDNFDVGRFIGRFLAIGGFDDNDTNPYLFASSPSTLGQNVKVYKKAFPILGFNLENYKFYIDTTIFAFLWKIYSDPLLFIVSNNKKSFLMMGLNCGILEGLKEDVYHNNMSPFLIEKLYLLEEALHLKTKKKHGDYVKTIHPSYESDECIQFESKYESSYIVNNIIMQSASATATASMSVE